MALSAAEKQKQYRQRKTKAEFFGNDFFVTRCFAEAALTGVEGVEADLRAIFEEIYDLGDDGPEAVRRLSALCYAFLTTRNAVYSTTFVQASLATLQQNELPDR